MQRYKIAQKVGKRVQSFRKKRKWTQEKLAEKLQMHVSTLGRIERGESNAPIQTINRIAHALGVKTNELL